MQGQGSRPTHSPSKRLPQPLNLLNQLNASQSTQTGLRNWPRFCARPRPA